MSKPRKIWPLSAPQIALVRALVPQCAGDLYIVGGYVRDVLMGVPHRTDLDLVYDRGGPRPCQDIARALDWHTFVLDADRGHWRFLWKRDARETQTVDIAPMQGDSIAQDLSLRDCTINAMAVKIAATCETGATGTLWDPTGGQTDLAQATVRPVSRANLRADPLRMLRLVRLAHTHRLRLHADARAFLRTPHVTLNAVSGERIREEGWRILLQGRSPLSQGIRLLHETRLYEAAFGHPVPTDHPLQGAAQGFVDRMGELATGATRRVPLAALASDTQCYLGQQTRQPLAAHYTRRHWWARLAILALPLLRRGGIWSVCSQCDTGTFQDALSPYWLALEAHLQRQAFARVEVRHSLAVLRCLSRLLWDLQTGQLRLMEPRALHRFIVHSGYTRAVSVLMDTLLILHHALSVPGASASAWTADYPAWQQKALVMLERTRFHRPRPLVSGTEVQHWFGLPPGPRVGRILDQVVEAEACREISTPREAKRYIAQLL